MQQSNERFIDLVDNAYSGKLRLPAFQRDWKWQAPQVISLYDSLRKQFPIGNLLFLKHSKEINLSPRLFEGCADRDSLERLALDGQQRITAGIALIYGIEGSRRYYLDINALKSRADDAGLDLDDEKSIKAFVQDIDDDDDYVVAKIGKGNDKKQLLEEHLINTTSLATKSKAQRALEEYEKKHFGSSRFLKYVIIPHFTLDNNLHCPVVTLNEDESLTAVTRIFSTINTTGKRLTPIEIVNATLFASDINLREQVEIYHQSSDFLAHMDPEGECLLQTIAQFSGKTPKKSLLPKTITHERFRLYYEDALSILDEVGRFLTDNLGVGFSATSKLIPYDSILPPMAAIMRDIKDFKPKAKSRASAKLEKWFIGSALAQRYQEGVHNKQENDVKEIRAWIEHGDEYMPQWLKDVVVAPDMKRAGPNGAIGRLLKCLMNSARPIDPIEEISVGYYQDAVEPPQYHHIWPKQFCKDHIERWKDRRLSHDWALNIIPISAKTNKRWNKMNPADQINDIENAEYNAHKRKEILDKLFLTDECLEILRRPKKSHHDYEEFIRCRYAAFVEKFKRWDFREANEPFEDVIDSDE